MNEGSGPAPKVGGQALADGVLMRTDRAWAIARADGSVEVGPFPCSPLGRVPVVRVLAALGPGLVMGMAALLRTGGARERRRPSRMVPLLAGLTVASFAASYVVGPLVTGSLAATMSVTFALTAAMLVALRLTAPGSLWRYHGAEHKAVAAHEAGVDLGHTGAVLACPRVHPRCGTNLVFAMALMAVVLAHLPLVPQLLTFLVGLAVTAELLGVAGRWPTALLSRVILGGGGFLQRRLTTAEPTPAEQRVGCSALLACLAEHERLIAGVVGPRVAVAA